MESKMSQSFLRVLAIFVLVSSLGLWVSAQDDPDPNSPTPILLSLRDTTRNLEDRKGYSGSSLGLLWCGACGKVHSHAT